jgi:phosphopantetheinyl transferase (holo-ACP synthase)
MIFHRSVRTGFRFQVVTIHSLLPQFSDCKTWLSKNEFRYFETIRSPERQKNWLAGRWLAKNFIKNETGQERKLQDIEILSVNAQKRSCPPFVLIDGHPYRCSLSVSHNDRYAGVVFFPDDTILFGIDIVNTDIKVRHLEKIQTFWFTEQEKSQVPVSDTKEIISRWALKEAAYKSMQHFKTGFAPLAFEVLRCGEQSGRPGVSASWRIFYRDSPLPDMIEAAVLESPDCMLAFLCRKKQTVLPYPLPFFSL